MTDKLKELNRHLPDISSWLSFEPIPWIIAGPCSAESERQMLSTARGLAKTDHVKVFGTDYPTADGTCIRDYIHVMDLADAHIQAIGYLKATDASSCLNLGNGTGHSVKEVLDTVKTISGRDFRIIESDRRPGDPPVLVSSYRKAADTLGWQPKIGDIELIIKTAYAWHSKNL